MAFHAPALARELLNDLHRFGHVGAFGSFVDILVVNPFQPVARDVVAKLLEGGCQFRVLLKRSGYTKHGERQATFFKLAKDAPHTRP